MRIIILFILVSNFIFAKNDNLLFEKFQKATIHFHDGTDLEGLAKVKSFLGKDKIKFKLYDDGEIDVWTELLVKGVTFHWDVEDEYFEYLVLHTTQTPRLLKVLEKGVVSLYVDIYNYWVFKDDEEKIIKHNNYKETDYKFYVIRESEEKVSYWQLSDLGILLKNTFKTVRI